MIVSEKIRGIAPYKPGKPIEELERETGIRGIVKLASNENPLGPSPLAVKAIERHRKSVYRYPDGHGYDLIRKISKRFSVKPEQISLGNGSNELIELLTRAFLVPGDEAIMADLTFSLYRIMTEAAQAEAVTVPLTDYRHDLGKMAGRITGKTRLVFICNPNNPTGTLIEEEKIRKFLNQIPRDVVVVLDHAYEEYITDRRYSGLIDQIGRYENLIILKTFSKLYGLAGMRIGYGIGSESMIEILNKVRQPFNTALLAQKAALAALDDRPHIKATLETNRTGKRFLYDAFNELGISFVPTEANFIFFEVDDGKRLFEWMLQNGVIIRHIRDHLMRVTIGTLRENRLFKNKLKTYLKLQKRGKN